MNSSALVSSYLVHGVAVETRSPNEAVAEALRFRLGVFETTPARSPNFVFEFIPVSESELDQVEKPEGRAVRTVIRSAASEVLYDAADDLLYLFYHGWMKTRCEASRGICRVFYPESELENLWRLTHPMFTLPLADCLRRRGRYTVHAAGISINGKGLLFPGESGYGKTTLTIALLRAGVGYLSDDLVLLAREEDTVRMLGLPDEVDVTENTARMFPELAPVLERPARRDWPKRQLNVAEIYGAKYVADCAPAAVICPRVAHADRTELEPISADEAFFELVPSVNLTEHRASQAHLNIIGDLLRQVPCYRMHTGRDLDTLCGRLTELVA